MQRTSVRCWNCCRTLGEEFHSLYQDTKSAAIAPYLVLLPPQSLLLEQMVNDGCGHSWGLLVAVWMSTSG